MKKFNKRLARALALLLVVSTLMLSLGSCKSASKAEVLRSENYTVSASMITYSLYDSYYYYVNSFGAEMMKLYFGIDTSVSLKKQYSDAEKTKTWFDVFKTEALDGFCNALSLCEAAVDAGVGLTEIDHAYIRSEIEEIRALAEKDGMTLKQYIKKIYSNDVSEEDIVKSLEIFRLANKMRYKVYGELEVSEKEIQDVFDKEGETYLQRKIIYFELTLANESEKTEKIKEYAQKMKEAKTEEEFRALAADFVKSDFCVNLSSNKKVVEEIVQNNVKEDDKTAVDRWFFAESTDVGSTYVYEGKSSHVVYMAVGKALLDVTSTRDLYTIIFEPSVYGTLDECKAKAEEVHALWKEGGADMKTFKSLAMQYTTDYASVYSGGYYPNVAKEELVESLDDWLFDESLKEGDSAVIKSEFGYHIVLYGGEGESAWKVPVIEGIKEEKISTLILNYVELHKIETISGNLKYVKGK